MKLLNCKTCIYNSDTLEHIGDYDENQVVIMKKYGKIPGWILWVLMYIIGIIFGAYITYIMQRATNDYGKISQENIELRIENNQLKSCIEITEHELNVEILAGKYATLRTSVPTDMNEVYKMCIQSGAWYPEIIMAQFILESGSGTSNIALNARNFYGMKYIGTKGRPTLQIPSMNVGGYGIYLNWQHSILDRVLWDDYMFNKTIPSKEQYLDKIGGIYAEDPDYIDKILRIANKWEAKTDSIRMVLDRDSVLIE